MKKILTLTAMVVASLSIGVGAASSATGGAGAATVTHYTASYSCDCFGTFTVVGVHVTNKEFPGIDNGGGDATGGRDNFSGSVSEPPPVEVVLNGGNAGDWCSDYDSQCTSNWSLTVEPDGSLSGWAIYPNA